MIRIDEIYNNTFWPWLQSHAQDKRIFFCDPPGNTSPDNLFNLGNDAYVETGYLFFHDQEPLDIFSYSNLFDEVQIRNDDLYDRFFDFPPKGKYYYDTIPKEQLEKIGAIVVSELGENLEQLKQQRHWNSYYYFFHGWAALDWYRGFDKTFLKQPTNIHHTFLLPNNIVGGNRRHRLELFVELERRNLISNNLISFPAVCPHEQVSVEELCKQYELDRITTPLPLVLDSFDNHANNSHMLTMWEYSAKSLLQVVTETAFYGNRLHLTEKTFKPIAMSQPFVIASCKGSLEYLRSYGFETFSSVWDESYDVADDNVRCSRIASLLEELEHADWKHLQQQCAPIVEHNFNHFYGGEFEKILWEEFNSMLEKIKDEFSV